MSDHWLNFLDEMKAEFTLKYGIVMQSQKEEVMFLLGCIAALKYATGEEGIDDYDLRKINDLNMDLLRDMLISRREKEDV